MPMNRLFPVLRLILWMFIGFSCYVIFLIFSDPFSGNDLILEHLLFGFVSFLKNNIPAISWNAATWGPGLCAFVITVAFVHRWLGGWAKRTGRTWSFATSFCLVLLVPVLFVISLLVPGVLLQWEALREVVWVNVR